MGLRPYQIKCLDDIKKQFDGGTEKLLAVLATGLGKTVLASHIPQWFPGKRTLFLVHTEELADQASKKMHHWNPTLNVGVEMGNSYAPPDSDIVVASVQTLGREGTTRLGSFKKEDFGAVIV